MAMVMPFGRTLGLPTASVHPRLSTEVFVNRLAPLSRQGFSVSLSLSRVFPFSSPAGLRRVIVCASAGGSPFPPADQESENAKIAQVSFYCVFFTISMCF